MEKQFNENGFIPKHGGFENLITYQKSEIVFIGTYHFTEKFISKFSRTVDQMQQAARSGKQNILEASMASGTSKETEIKLTNVARASLVELKEDYKDYLKLHKLTIWEKTHPYYAELTKKHRIKPSTYEIYQKGIESENPEVSANVLLSLVNVTTYLLSKQMTTLEKEFLNEGGLRERMTKARIDTRNSNRKTEQ